MNSKSNAQGSGSIKSSEPKATDALRGLDILAQMNTDESFDAHAHAHAAETSSSPAPPSGSNANPSSLGPSNQQKASNIKGLPSKILGASFELARFEETVISKDVQDFMLGRIFVSCLALGDSKINSALISQAATIGVRLPSSSSPLPSSSFLPSASDSIDLDSLGAI